MFDALKKGAMRWVGARMKEFVCPKCGCKFQPFRERELTSWNDKIVCPQCSHEVALRDALQTQKDAMVNPSGPFAQPADTKIQRETVSETQLLFFIPASGRWGGLLFFSIFWNAISWLIFGGFLFAHAQRQSWFALPIVALFPLIGIGLAYAAARARFAVHLLYLSPDRIRLQRQLFGRSRNFDLATGSVTGVRKAEFYRRNYQPVYGVEIKSASGKIRFGSVLTDDEKNWLCWAIREFIRPYAPSLA